jgi:penicillin-binding protein 2
VKDEVDDSSELAAGSDVDGFERPDGSLPGWGGQRRPRGRVTPRSRWRLIVLQALVVALVATLLGRLVWMQIDEGSQAAAAVDARVRDIAIPAPRGLIYDQAGRVVSTNRPATDVLIDRGVLMAQPDGGGEVVNTIANLTGTSAATILGRLQSCSEENAGNECFTGGPYEPAPVVLDTTVESVMDLIENPSKYPGVSVRTRAMRDYDFDPGANAAHLLGYLGSPTQEEVQDDPTLHSGSLIGRGGIEASYDEYLRGTDGLQRISLDRTGITGDVLSESTPETGASVVSTIDMQLQSTVEQELAAAVAAARYKGYPADSAAAVVLDVTNGDVLAAASVPTYDRRVFSGGLSDDEYAAITSEEQPLLDRTIQAELAPASTFKPITATAAATAGYDFSEQYACPPAYYVGTQAFANYESSAFPPLTIADALKVSCNTVFYKFAAEMYAADGGLDPTGTPRELIPNTARAFGYGARTGVDLPGEASGKVTDRAQKKSDYEELSEAYCTRAETGYPEEPDPAKAEMYQQFAAEYCADGDKYRVGDAINQAVGQGDILVTPLQMARAYAAIGNGGTLYTPHTVKAVVGHDGSIVKEIEPEVAGTLPDSPETLAYLQEALQTVTTGGTAAPAFAGFPLNDIPVAAKTGTAEVANKETTSLFASYAPADNPKFAVVVVITQAGVGGEMSAPAARKIYDALFGVVDGQANPARSVLVGGAPQTQVPESVRK